MRSEGRVQPLHARRHLKSIPFLYLRIYVFQNTNASIEPKPKPALDRTCAASRPSAELQASRGALLRYQRVLGSCTRSLPQPNLTLKKTKPSSFLTSHTTSGRALREGRYGQVVEGGIQRAAKRGKGKQRWDEGEEVMQVGSEHLSQSRARDQGVQARKNEEDPWEYRKMARESLMDNQLTKWKAVENAGCRTPGANC